MRMSKTTHPVVLIHGIFGYGQERPVWNLGPPYWPEQALKEINPNHIIVDVGTVSSDHDRACEAFYQLMGGTVDYGEAHARQVGHERFGRTFAHGSHPHWSADHPVHLVGHSMGATTAMELYQLLCLDAFGVGSNHKWVRSLISIAGPLTGSTISHLFLMEDDTPVISFKRGVAAGLGVWVKLYHAIPWLRGLYNLRMDQWHKYSLREVVSCSGPLNTSQDMSSHSCLPTQRIARNRELVHMDELYLLSITTSPRHFHPPYRLIAGCIVLGLLGLGGRHSARGWLRSRGVLNSTRRMLAFLLSMLLWIRLRRLDYARSPSLAALAWLMRRCAAKRSDGFDPDHWQQNDGAVNIHSMLRPWFPGPPELLPGEVIKPTPAIENERQPPRPLTTSHSTASLDSVSSSNSLSDGTVSLARCASHISIDGFHREAEYRSTETDNIGDDDIDHSLRHRRRFIKGRWYVYRVDRNHLAGTHFDADAPQLYQSLFALIRDEYEGSAAVTAPMG